jgi:hypothetical protein
MRNFGRNKEHKFGNYVLYDILENNYQRPPMKLITYVGPNVLTAVVVKVVISRR